MEQHLQTFSTEEITELSRSLNLKYGTWLNDRFFKVKINEEYDAVYVDITLMNASEMFFYPVQSRMEIKNQNLNTIEAVKFLVSYIESYFDEYFEQNEEVYLPTEWMAYNCEGIDFQLKGQMSNKHIESLADRWLAGETIPQDELKGLRLKH